MCDSNQPCLTPLPAKDIPRQGRGCVMSPRRGHHIFLLWNPTCGKFCFTMMGYTPNSVAQKLFCLTWWDSNQNCRPAEAGFTMRPQPPMVVGWSYVLLNCIKTVVLRQRLDRHRFESHLGLGTFTDVNLYLFLLSLFVSVETSTLSPPTRALTRYKEEFLPLTDYQWCLSHWAFVSLECPEFIWLLPLRVRFPSMGVEPGIAGSPSPGFYHWATATVGNLMKLHNFI